MRSTERLRTRFSFIGAACGYNPRMSEAPESHYENPLVTRYAGERMRRLFSARRRAQVWRDLWIALAEVQQELGLAIEDAQIQELREQRDEIDLSRVAELERDLRHDVMAHVHHFGEVAPKARGILHLGATSCFVTDNADLLLFREGLQLVAERLVAAIAALREQALAHASLPCLGYTHFQAAQPTTFGKRCCLWIQDLLFDLERVDELVARLPARGVKGTTGTQASFLDLFDGDHAKVRELDRRVADRLGFDKVLAVSGQTYTRKLDHDILSVLAGIAQSASKFAVDVRLLSHEGEVSEPFADKQIGSSAMAYKRNPMRSERICSLARLVQTLLPSAGETHATQWLERSLDDSAIRRISLPESYLAVDACLILMTNIARGMRVYKGRMRRHMDEQLPFLATELLLMEGVRQGGDRQDLHERIRQHAVDAAHRMKEEGVENPMLAALEADEAFAFARGRYAELLDPMRLVGRAPEQVAEFVAECVDPAIAGRSLAEDAELRV